MKRTKKKPRKLTKLTPTKAFAAAMSIAEVGTQAMKDELIGQFLNEDEEAAIEGAKRYVSGLRRKISVLVAMLREVQKKKFHEPDSDFREYCNGCGRSPYNQPPHTDDCLVPRIAALLEEVG